jgi:PIN domain nuclease of toxin-antitoxin system
MKYVLDACALLAYLDKESGWEKIDKILYQAETGFATVYMNIVNFVEVYYDRIRCNTTDELREFLENIDASPIYLIGTMSLPVIHESARFKANYRLSLADSFTLATGFCYNAAVVTADHHELDIIEQQEIISFLWFR